MKLYTKTGDDGTTGLLGGSRVSKDALRVAAYGEIDELNAVLGWCGVVLSPPLGERVQLVQSTLFQIGAELATMPKNSSKVTDVLIDEAQVRQLESWIDEATDQVPELKSFILPGGGEAGARLHVARAVSRRAERNVVTLSKAESVRPIVLQYVNRISDLLFVWARFANHQQNQPEVPWGSTPPAS
jgi:cob(I)alamin adenosyltransferase